jgi:hypothetical protein
MQPEEPEPSQLLAVSVGLPRETHWRGQTIQTGIFESPIEGRVHVGPRGIEGDGQADLSVHGGIDKAVYAYDDSRYRRRLWSDSRSNRQQFHPSIRGTERARPVRSTGHPEMSRIRHPKNLATRPVPTSPALERHERIANPMRARTLAVELLALARSNTPRRAARNPSRPVAERHSCP